MSTASLSLAIANGILADIEAHIDALVEAGVLSPILLAPHHYRYEVIAPHEHDWRVHTVTASMRALPQFDVFCEGCDTLKHIVGPLPKYEGPVPE